VLAGAYQVWRRPRIRPGGAAYVAVGVFAMLAVASAAWSARPAHTEKRALAFLILVLAAAALADATAGRRDAVRRILAALFAGATLVAALGLYMLWTSHDQAVQAASTQYPARYRGIGQNPNTVSLLLALAIPLGLWLWATARSRAARVGFGAALLLLDGSIVASGSRGAVIAALVGTVVWLATETAPWRRRLLFVAVAGALFVANVAIMQIPDALPGPSPGRGIHPRALNRDAELTRPLADEIGSPALGGSGAPIHRTLFGTSGRAQAWDAALHQASKRPVAGYGFGTESVVFADRYYGFDSSVPENSYIGVLLQLGIVGVVAFAGLLVALAVAAFRALRAPPGPARALARVCASVLAAAAVLGLTQSYLTSIGNLASPTVWIPVLLLPALAWGTRSA
jgi:O-antigen ligase/polysaccharide polymerase Wzy-like membrane protein